MRKAEDPVPFVPTIVRCTVLERHPDGFVREIVVEGREGALRERVRFEPERRVVFDQLDDPDLDTIVNEIGLDGQGRLSLTLAVTPSRTALTRAATEPAFLEGLKASFR